MIQIRNKSESIPGHIFDYSLASRYEPRSNSIRTGTCFPSSLTTEFFPLSKDIVRRDLEALLMKEIFSLHDSLRSCLQVDQLYSSFYLIPQNYFRIKKKTGRNLSSQIRT